jgi:hypothetical protein
VIQLVLKVEAGKLAPATAADAELLPPYEGQSFTAKLTSSRPRSLTQLALWWVVCGFIAENYHDDLTKEDVDQIIRIAIGHCHVFELADGVYVRRPKSISFNAMKQDEFNAFMEAGFDAMARKFGGELSQAARQEMLKMMEGDRGRG